MFPPGSSSGIGREAAIEFAKEGANVVIHGRDQARLDVNIISDHSIVQTLSDYFRPLKTHLLARSVKISKKTENFLTPKNALESLQKVWKTLGGYFRKLKMR